MLERLDQFSKCAQTKSIAFTTTGIYRSPRANGQSMMINDLNKLKSL